MATFCGGDIWPPSVELEGQKFPFQPFQGSSNTQTQITELLCPPQHVQSLLPVKGNTVKVRNSTRDSGLMVASKRGGCFSLRSVLNDVQSLKRSAKMRHGQRRLLEWVGEHRGVSGTCLLPCSLFLSLSDQSISLNAFILQAGSEISSYH